jgi:hypothetical protein
MRFPILLKRRRNERCKRTMYKDVFNPIDNEKMLDLDETPFNHKRKRYNVVDDE